MKHVRRATCNVRRAHVRRAHVRRATCYAVVGLVGAAWGCVAPRTERVAPSAPSSGVRVLVADHVERVPLERYVRTVVLSEFAPSDGDPVIVERMLEVQAILSRTYALVPRHTADGFDVCSTTHCQLYLPSKAMQSRWSSAADTAVSHTAGVIVWFGDMPARVVYHADCGGRTSAAEDVWGGADLPYLTGAIDDAAAARHAEWRFAPQSSALLAVLNGDPRTRVGSFLSRIDVLRRDAAGRAQIVALDGERSPVIRADELRVLFSRAFGPRAFRSTWFTVRKTDRGFEFTGRGFGHGVGLCQAGAYARIAAGATPAQVLGHYFPGTAIH
jgi:stage II sporulation protein D (peptidoglycan lytic transglycosylase)